ncbi:MAG: heat-inducible transcriptional repressor HrcA [Synergistaceae bacterium]|jgi:heat-inducible transcriptional repressor|nr:heat-inducible transcriptional repressor HrcA [Synergistaceae bacterium]
MLTDRQLGIVLAVVYEYIKTGEPAGSRTITKKYIKGLSPATIRNEMADLEEMGYFYQPHTSSGRLPTAKSYRVYVDSVTSRERMRPHESSEWQKEIKTRRSGIEDLLTYVTHMISRLTNYVGVAAVAGLDDTEIQHIDLMPLGGTNILALIVLKGGLVHHSQLTLPFEIEPAVIEELTHRINTVASGRSWSEVRDVLYDFVLNGLENVGEACRMAIRELDNFLTMQNYRFFSSGAQYILNQPHFHAIGRLQAVLSLLEQEKPLSKMIERCRQSASLNVSIGEENEAEGMEESSMILIPAQARQQKAVLGLIGPLRMDYEKSINILEVMVDALKKE